MKRMICILLAVLCVFTLAACTGESVNDANPTTTTRTTRTTANTKNFKLSRAVTVYSDYAVMPISSVIEGLGFKISWVSDDHAAFTCNGNDYVMRITNKTLTKAGDNTNYLVPSPDNDHFYCEAVDGEILADSNTIVYLFDTLFDYPITISFDSANATVTVAVK